MITTINGISIGRYEYDMSKEFTDSAIDCVIDACKQPNMYPSIPNTPAASLWSEDDSGRKLHELPLFKDFLSTIKPMLQEYLKFIGVNENDAVITAMWGVHYKQNECVVKHNHVYSDCKKNEKGSFIKRVPHKRSTKNDIISILLYLNKPKNSGNLLIEDAMGIEHEFDLKGGDIIMFPSYAYQHRTLPNKSEEDKFVIVLEVVMKWVTDDEIEGKTLEQL